MYTTEYKRNTMYLVGKENTHLRSMITTKGLLCAESVEIITHFIHGMYWAFLQSLPDVNDSYRIPIPIYFIHLYEGIIICDMRIDTKVLNINFDQITKLSYFGYDKANRANVISGALKEWESRKDLLEWICNE